MKKVIIFGTGGFAEVAYFYFSKDSIYEVVAFTEHEKFITKNKIFDLPIIPFEIIEKKYPPSENLMFIAVVYSKVNEVREKIFHEAKTKNYKLASYVSSKVIKWEEPDIGENCFILENVVIQPFVKIGDDVIIWSGNHIGHHSKIGDHCFITSHVVISGNTTIEPNCFLGVNSTIRDGITIAKKCVIGAGAVILKNTKEGEVYITKGTELLPISSSELKHI